MPYDIKELDLKDSFSLLTITPISKLQEKIIGILKGLATGNQMGIYVSLSKPYDSLKETFKENGIDVEKLFFIDCISKSLDKIVKKENVFYVSNAGDLDDLGISITDILENNKVEFLVIDSLETLLIYNRINTVAIFTQSVVRKSSKFKLKTVIITSNNDKSLVDEVAMFFDKVVGADE
ncbi:MAG: ATPase domain-containing protein [Candidatus Aenigmatarchaeota archaeon]